MSQNLLHKQASPYLLQHKDNPVHWQPWGADALAQAQAENKPILLSIGYAACHWCHVMAHESFEDEASAAVMNELFINIKVDREERPDIDDIYMNALHMMGVQGGWPLTMFLTPEGQPFWGGTYFPKTARAGMAAFTDICREIARLYYEENEKVQNNAGQLTNALKTRQSAALKAPAQPNFINQAAETLSKYLDEENGGMQGQPKFPQAFVFQFLWETAIAQQNPALQNLMHHTALQISSGGIYDHLGGGFARYSVDAFWRVPHFEKMLYDNALLIDFFTVLWCDKPLAIYRDRITKTIDWLARELTLSYGGFAASLDADTEGEEGRFYVWTQDEIDEVLGEKNNDFCDYYDITKAGNFEGKNVLNTLAGYCEKTEAALGSARDALFQARLTRPQPALDDKVLADWNGLMIAALARASLSFNQPDWLTLAQNAYEFIMTHMHEKSDGLSRLTHAWRDGVRSAQDTAEDYANMADAALALYAATNHASYLQQAEDFCATLKKLFWCDQLGGYYMTAADAEAILVRPRHARDNACPSANGTLIWVFSRLELYCGKPDYGHQAETLLESFWIDLEKSFPQMTTSLMHYARHQKSLLCVISGAESDAVFQEMKTLAAHHPHMGLMVQLLTPESNIPKTHPAYESLNQKNNQSKTQAFLCTRNACLPPVDSAGALKQKLDSLFKAK